MNRIPEPLAQLNENLKRLHSEPGFARCQQVIDSVIRLLGVEPEGDWKLFTDSQGKIKTNAGWFMMAEGFADKRAAYKVAEDNGANIDFKAYWMSNSTKSVISWLVALTPNFEDEPFYGRKNIGVDFIIPEAADSVVVILSNQYVIRTLELQEDLRSTQLSILNKWLAEFDFENKAQVHKLLWDSFDLEPVNKDFYKGISSRFVQLKQHLTEMSVFDDKHAAIFANRLIGRIVFCWFLDKKGIINRDMKYFDTEGVNSTEYYHAKLEVLFFSVFNTPLDERGGGQRKGQKRLFPETDPKDLFNVNIDLKTPFLNGGLFEAKDDEVVARFKLSFPNDFFDDFYQFLRHYNFTTDESSSTFQQVAIDPEMLGRIFENLLAEQVEETGEQARKAKGAFYTPREIVDYMCKESLREYLKSKIPESEDRDRRLAQLLDTKAHEYRDQQTNYKRDLNPYKNDILEALDNIKVLDPACGSGAFPMGMLQLLLQCYERLEPRFDSYKSKLVIIKNNLYGIDIDPMGVEISRLRAWLSIVVDESSDIKPLPNLDFKFVCANSLIPVPEEKDMALALDPFFSNLERRIGEYFTAADHETKGRLRSDIKALIDNKVKEKYDHVLSLGKAGRGKHDELRRQKNQAAIDENIGIIELWGSYLNIFRSDEPVRFFATRYFFPGVHSGFNIVIANPPYLKERDNAHIFKSVNESPFGRKWHQGKMDYWFYFLHKSIDLVSPDGCIAFITSRYWLNSSGASRLIGRINKELSFVIVVDIGKLKVFDAVAGQHMVALYSKRRRDLFTYKTLVHDARSISSIKGDNISISELAHADVFVNGNIVFSNSSDSVNVPIRQLGELYDSSVGVQESIDKVSRKQLVANPESNVSVGDGVFVLSKEEVDSLHLDEAERSILRPYLDPHDVGKYVVRKTREKYLIYSDASVMRLIADGKSCKRLKKHLDRYSKFITSSNRPYGIHRPRSRKFFDGKKIIFKGMFVDPQFTIDTSGYYFGFSFCSIISRRPEYTLEYLLGLLNSTYAKDWFFKNGKLRGAGVDIGVQKLRQFPVPAISAKNKPVATAVEQKVTEALLAKRKDVETDISEIVADIDALVNELYQLKRSTARVADDEAALP